MGQSLVKFKSSFHKQQLKWVTFIWPEPFQVQVGNSLVEMGLQLTCQGNGQASLLDMLMF